MPTINITFDHPQASVPKYKFSDHLAVKDDNSPREWLVGEVVGLTLETESYLPRWWYSIKLDVPHGLTEEYLEDDVIPATEIGLLQAEWECLEVNWQKEDDYNPLPKFQPGMRVKFNKQSGYNLLLEFAEVVTSRYVRNHSWSGWVYKLDNKNLTEPIEIGEIWLELAANTAEAPNKHSISK